MLWFDAGHGRDPVHILLEFKMDVSIQAQLAALRPEEHSSQAKIEGMVNPARDGFPLQMVTTDAGICLWHPLAGLWFIPFADIDAYLKSVEK